MLCQRVVYAFLLTVPLVLAIGCSRPVDDKQIAQSIQSQIQKDTAISGEIEVESESGVVTLKGQVPNDAAKSLAARIAADTPEVKQVVNNIVVAPVSAKAARPRVQRPAPVRQHTSAAAKDPPEEPAISAAASQPANPAPLTADAPPVSTPPTDVPQSSPLPPPGPEKYTITAGTIISIRLIDALDSTKNKAGDVFHATLKSPIRVDDEIAVPAGADIEGRVVEAAQAGRFTGHATLRLELSKLTSHGHSYPLNTEDVDRSNGNRGKGTAETVGAGGAVGAIIGAIAGGGKGAGIGTLAGAGAGAAGRAARKDKGINFPSETVLSFKLQVPLTVTVLPGENDSARR